MTTATDLNALLLALLIEAAEREESARKETSRDSRLGTGDSSDLCDDHSMTLEEFKATTSSSTPPAVSRALQALWHDARGEWDTAHEIANGVHGQTGAWVHAYLHRKEGDLENAAYWYNRAGQSVATEALETEWDRIAAALLSGSTSI